MQAIEALTQRVSHGKLKAPGPTAEQREHMETAALRAADHGCLRPWRYLYIDGSGLEALGQLFLYAAKQAQPELSETQAQRFAAMPLRAPAIYIAIATITAH
ncbi:MAG: nitroreductase family protein, partial [Cellvibrionaceae bacterium]|nr:nitroreductase family protein [Cellvibrionaceae bacterium]